MECNGRWTVDVPESGDYTFELRRWPREEGRPITEGIPGRLTSYHGVRAIDVTTARIRIDGREQHQAIEPEDRGVSFTFHLEPGEKHLETELTDGGGISLGAYYVYVENVD